MATATRHVRTARSSARERHAALQRMLAEESQVLRSRMGGLRESASVAISDVEDGEDRLASLGDPSVTLAALDLSSRTVQDCEAALRRLATGRYGICADCGATLSSARLRALPFAEVCRACQEQRDTPSTPARSSTGFV